MKPVSGLGGTMVTDSSLHQGVDNMVDSHGTPQSASTQPVRKKRKFLKRISIVLVVALLLSFVGVAILPSLLSGPLKGMVLSQINNQLNGKATIESMSLSWFGAQQVTGFKLADQAGQMMLEIDRIDLPGVSLWGLVRGNRDFGDVTVHINALNVVQEADGTNNLQNVVKASSGTTTSSSQSSSNAASSSASSDDAPQALSQMIPTGTAANIKLVMDQFSLQAPDQKTTTLADTHMDLAVKGGEPLVGKLTSNVTNGALHGSVTSNLAIDTMVDMSDTQIALDVTPQAWQEAAPNASAKLLEPFGIALTINRLKLPAFSGAAGLKELEADLTMTVTDVKLQSKDAQLGILQLTGTSLQVNAMGEKQPVTLALKGQVTQSNQQGAFDLNIKLENLLDELSKPKSTDVNAKPAFSNVKARVVGDVQNVGLVIFDELFQTGGLIRNAVGPTLTASINSQLQYDQTSGMPNGNLDLKAKAQFVNADLALKIDENGVSQAAPGQMNMQITPALYAVAMKVPEGKPVLLAQPVMSTLQLNRLSIPRDANQWQIHNAVFDLSLNFEDVLLKSSDDQVLKLSKPAWTLKSEKLGQKIVLDGGFEASQAGGSPGSFKMNASGLNLYDDAGNLNRDKAQFEATMTLLPWQLPRMLPIFKKLKFNINSLVNQVIGARQVIALKGRMLPTQAGNTHPKVPNMQLKLSTSSFAINTDLNATIKDDLVVLDPTSTLDVTVTPALLALLMTPASNGETPANVPTTPQPAQAAAPVSLAKPVTFKGTITELAWPLDEAKMDQAIIAMQISAGHLEPTGLPGGLSASLRNTVLSLGKGNLTTLPIRITADMFESNVAAGKLDAAVSLASVLKEPVASDLKLKMTDVPVSLIDTLSGMDGKVFAMLGPRINSFVVTADGQLDKNMQANITAGSDVLEVAAKARLDGQFLIVEPGSKVNLKVTPDAIMKLQKSFQKDTSNKPAAPDATSTRSKTTSSSDWQLTQPTTLKFNVDKLVLPTGSSSLAEAQIGLGFEAEKMAFLQSSTKVPLNISDLKMLVSAAKLSSPLIASFTANMTSVDAQGKSYQSPLTSKTTVTNLLDKDGKVDAMHATIKTDTQIPQLPIELIDNLTGQQGKLAGIIGPTADVKAVGSYPGDMDISLVGKFAALSVPARIDANRTLTLRKDAVVTLAVTPETAQTLLKYGNPILIDATGSRDPIKATIFAKGFSMPLEGFDIKKLVADMDLELGTITLQSSWLLNSIKDGLGGLDRALNISQKQDAKFTRLSLSMRDGMTKTNDMWMQIDNVSLLGKSRLDTLTIGTQGNVDLVNKTVNMGMALPAVTLYSIGGSLRKYVSADTIFELPIAGPLDKVKLQGLDKLALQITAMVAGGELGGDQYGSLGSILGQVAGSALGGGDVKQFTTKRSWPNKPVIKTPEPAAEQTQPATEQTKETQSNQVTEPKPEEKKKNDTEKAIDVLRGLLR